MVRRFPKVQVVDPIPLLCNAWVCRAKIDGTIHMPIATIGRMPGRAAWLPQFFGRLIWIFIGANL